MFTSYEELMQAVEERRKERLTLEVDMGSKFSPEHEAAKKELEQAKGLNMLTGGQGFLGDNIAALEQRVAETRPPQRLVFIQFEKLDLNEWAALVRSNGMTPIDQYERILPKTFAGVYGTDPVKPDDWPEDEEWVEPQPLTMDPLSVSSKGGAKSILSGGVLNSVIQTFMAWQNSGGDVTIRPTRSGRD